MECPVSPGDKLNPPGHKLNPCKRCGIPFEGGPRQLYCEACRADRVRMTCSDCGSAFEGSRSLSRRPGPAYCPSCVRRRQSEGRKKTAQPWGSCNLDSCKVPVPPWRRFCSNAHWADGVRGRARPELRGRVGKNPRMGQEVFCDWDGCGVSLGYWRASKVRRAKHHYCSDHVGPWREAGTARLATVPLCVVCGAALSGPGVTRCRACWLKGPRKRHHTKVMQLVDEVIAKHGGNIPPIKQIVRELQTERHPPSRNAVRRALARRDRPALEFGHKGSVSRYRRGCRCGNCVEVHRAAGRDRLRAVKAGLILERRVPPPHATLARYLRHRRDGEKPCENCREARNTYERARYHASALRASAGS